MIDMDQGVPAFTAVQISTGLWVAKLQRMGLAGPKWRSRKQVWRWVGCCRRLSPLPWGVGGESSEPGEGLLWCLHRIAIERGGDPSPVPRPDEVHRDRGTSSPQGRGPYIRFGHEGNLDKLGRPSPCQALFPRLQAAQAQALQFLNAPPVAAGPRCVRSPRVQARWNQLKRQSRPALAHAHKRDPRRPALGEEAEHGDWLDADTAEIVLTLLVARADENRPIWFCAASKVFPPRFPLNGLTVGPEYFQLVSVIPSEVIV